MEVNVDKLRELRRLRVLTLRELEEESGVSYNTIWRLENGHREARPSTIRKLAAALGVEASELVVTGEGSDA
jgi:transcriptional regulator with XRE-family HTH domain